MKSVLCCLFILTLLPSPAAAEEGGSAFERFIEQLLRDISPTFEGMERFLEQMGPRLQDLLEQVEDWNRYEAPEILPNGDIIIRRKSGPLEKPESPIDI